MSEDAGWAGAAGALAGLTAVTVLLSFAAALLWTRLRLGRWLG
ncbi:acyltransferase [Streptomyces violaceorubidus]